MLSQAASSAAFLLPPVAVPLSRLRPAVAALSVSSASGSRALSVKSSSVGEQAALVGASTAVAAAAATAAGRRRRRKALARGVQSEPSFRRFGHAPQLPFEASRRFSVAARAAGPVNLTAEVEKREALEPVPVILLSGFLGTGKTTLLKHWLEQNQGVGRIGVVVNDVGAVNIDAKLVKQQETNPLNNVETIQLENGCACCSLGDELMVTIHDLVALSDSDKPFSHIIVELSGVAEPQRVREIFQRAKEDGYQIGSGVELSKVVTMMDASSFCTDYMEYKRIIERDDLMEGEAGEAADYKVVELLVEQCEAADVVVLNKVDLATKEDLEVTRAMVNALNKKANLHETSFGKVGLSEVLADNVEASAEAHGHESDSHESHGHEDASHDDSHAESHSSGHSHGGVDCSDPVCEDASHDDSHAESSSSGHSHGGVDCSDPGCEDASHDDSHAESHSTGHSHGGVECSDPGCEDVSTPTPQTTAEDRFGISSFTYRARRPFQAERLAAMLQTWPEPSVDCLGEMLNEQAEASDDGDDVDAEMPLSRVIRSKGFAWLHNYPSSRMYWSHAGKHMLLQYEGVWWGAMSKEQLKLVREMALQEYERAEKEDFEGEWADRRQEVVFIGQRMDQAGICAALDKCLVNNEELEEYKVLQKKDQKDLDSMWDQEQEMGARLAEPMS